MIGGLSLNYDFVGSVESKGTRLEEPWSVVFSGALRVPYSSVSAAVYKK